MTTNTVKHTPGPWLVTRQYVVGPRDESDSQGFGMVAGVADVYGDNRNQDARLIAAAPDLLEVAQRILDRGYVSESIEEERDDHLALVAALSKATGSPAPQEKGRD